MSEVAEIPEVEQEVATGIVEEAEEEGEEPGFELEEKAEGDEPEEEKEAAGGDAWVTDRDESGNPVAPAEVDVPRVAAGSGSEAWVTDRDKNSKPEAPKKMEIPQVDVKAAAKKVTPLASLPPGVFDKTAMSRKDYIIIADALRSFRMPNQQREELAQHLSKYLRSDNYNFSEGIFVDYVMGRGGNRGGNKFKGDAPNTPDTLFV